MRSTPHNASSSKIHDVGTSALLCRICGQPVPVETAKSDGDGKPIHEQCYALKVKLENATSGTHNGNVHAKGGGTTERTLTRPWKVIAEEVSHEHDSKKMTELISELNRAMDEQGIGKPPSQQKK